MSAAIARARTLTKLTEEPALRELWQNLYFVDQNDVTDQPNTLRAIGGVPASLHERAEMG